MMSQLLSRTLQGDDPPFLTVGTDVSAKYKGAFCEAKIKKVVRNIKCKVTLKGGGSITVNDDTIKGNLHVGNTVEVKANPKKDAVEAVIVKMQDCSQYTVVFDDGDITTLRRSALCLKSGRHFNESETLDQLPLTHPEHFSTPVIAGRRGRRGRALSEESEPETRRRAPEGEREPHAGRVVLVETGSGGERRRPHQAAFPALVVAPTAQDTVKIKVKEDYLVRSFKDGRYYTVPKKEAREFRKGLAPAEWGGVEAALQYLNNGVLPPHWDRDLLFNEPSNASDDSSDDEPREEKDHFVAQLFKFMDDRGTPLNRNPTIANRDIDLYRLFSGVQKLGGYNRVTNQNQWKTIAGKMGFTPTTPSITNLCKQAYKKFLHDFEDFYRKLGVTLVAHPRGARTPPTGRSLIRDRDKLTPAAASAQTPSTSRAKEEPEKVIKTEKKEIKDTKCEVKSEKEDKAGGKSEVSDEDSADNQPLATPTPVKQEKEEKEKEKIKEKEKPLEQAPEEKREERLTKRSSIISLKRDSLERRTFKPRRPPSLKRGSGSHPAQDGDANVPGPVTLQPPLNTDVLQSGGDSSGGGARSSRRPHASTDSDSSGRASRCGVMKKTPSRRSQSANSASSGNTIASSNSSKRPRKRTITERTSPIDSPRAATSGGTVKANVGDKLKVYYGPNQSESKVTYDAKVIEKSAEGMLRVHYTGWNTRYDEWIKPQRIAINVTQTERSRPKTDGNNSRRSRSSRIQQDRPINSDTDTDSDSEDDIKRPPKRIDDKSCGSKTTPPTKDSPSATPPPRKISASDDSTPTPIDRSRKRTMRGAAANTSPSPTASVSPVKRPRTMAPHASHQGKDYDLNEIRSELKGLHSVKTEPEEIKQEPVEKSPPPPEPIDEPKQEKPDDDVYEFKEPEPFEFELLDEKKKRTHRIFDDVSPKYSMKSMIDDITEEIRARPSQRSPSLSPFRDYSSRDATGRQTPEDESRDDIFSLDGDSLAGDVSLGPDFEGFTPAKNQETYSKKTRLNRVPKEILEEPPDISEEDQMTDDEQIDAINKEDSDLPPLAIEPSTELVNNPTVTESSVVQNKEEETGMKNQSNDLVEIETPTMSLFIDAPIKTIDETLKPTAEIIKDDSEEKKEEKEVTTVKEQLLIEKEKTKTEKEKIKSDNENTKIDKEKPKTDKEKPKTNKEKPKTDKEKPNTDKEKPNTDNDKPKTDKGKPKLDKEKSKLDKEKPKLDKEKPKLDKEKPKLDKEKPNPDKEKQKSEAEKTKVEKEKITVVDKETTKVAPTCTTPVSENEPEIKIEESKQTVQISTDLVHSALVDTEESKSEPDSPARMEELIPEPPAFLLHSEGPKIAERLLKAINSAKKRISTSPPPQEDASKTPKRDFSKIKVDLFKTAKDSTKPAEPPKSPSISPTSSSRPITKSAIKVDIIKPKANIAKTDPTKDSQKIEKPDPLDMIEAFKIEIPLESRIITDPKRDKLETSLAPLQNALDVFERRRSGSELPLTSSGKSNKVLSDTIQKLSTQITQGPTTIPLPTFQREDRSDSCDSDDSDRRLIIDKLSEEDTASGSSSSDAGRRPSAPCTLLQDKTKSPVEWSAGESLLMLEGFCKAERATQVMRHQVTVPKPTEEDSNLSLLLCEETIPGSPAPEVASNANADPSAPTPARSRSMQMPFASAPSNSPEEGSTGKSGRRSGDRDSKAGDRDREAEWDRELEERDPALDNTPPTTPDTSPDASPRRERRMSEQDSMSGAPGDEEGVTYKPHKPAKLFSGRCRKASESSSAAVSAARRARRSRRDSDERGVPPSTTNLKYNFYVELDPAWDSNTRINLLMTRLAELRRAYHSVKAELAAVDRRRKKLRRKEREAVKAAKAACL